MKTYVVTLLFIGAALIVLPKAECSWLIVVNEDGLPEIIDASKPVKDSESTEQQLKKDVSFRLFTVDNPTEAQEIYLNDDSTLANSNFDASLPTRFLIHGWQSSSESEIATVIRDAYLKNGAYNIIAVDWNSYAKMSYFYARSKIITVAKYVGLMIDYLESKGMNLKDLIMEGHSLGGHIAGVSARSAKNDVGIVIAMDPAGPLFNLFDTEARLTNTDADFVQVIHTSAGLLGYLGDLGDADIYVNCGSSQDGCGFDLFRICAHGRSFLYQAESVAAAETRRFLAYRCESCEDYTGGLCVSNESTYLGGVTVDTSASGVYWVSTNRAASFAKD